MCLEVDVSRELSHYSHIIVCTYSEVELTSNLSPAARAKVMESLKDPRW